MFDLSGPDDLVILGDNLDVLAAIPDASVDLVYVDPPFNTGGPQVKRIVKATRVGEAESGLVGFNGARHRRDEISRM